MKSPKFFGQLKKPRFYIRQVVGDSMLPTLPTGKVVVIWNIAKPRVGSIVMFEHDGLQKIKRVDQINGTRLYVLGDNPASSTDSRNFGWIERKQVCGTLLREPKRPITR